MKRTRRNIPKGYDSWFEYDLHSKFKRCEYHVNKLTYTQVKTYEPDFVYYSGDYTIYIEAKGRFREKPEARKYVDVKKALKPEEELVFVFQNPNNRMPAATKRKDGSYYCMSDWAERNGFDWYTPKTLPKEWTQ